MILLSLGSGGTGGSPLGIVLSLGAGLIYAAFTLANKRLIALHPPHEVMAVSFGVGGVLLLPVFLLSPVGWLVSPQGALVALHLGLIATGLSYLLFGRGLVTTPVSTVGTLTLAEPLTAALLGIVVVGEALTLNTGLGMALITAGLLLMTVRLSRANLE
jgi:DME family drug/metabolite transporter